MSIITSLQNLTKKALTLQGFVYETHTFGHGTITLWVKNINRKSKQSSALKRMVIIPGFGDTPLSWIPTVQLLQTLGSFKSKQFDEIVLLEFSGYIGSLRNKRAIDSISGLTDAVDKILTKLAPHTLVGHSMGGFLSAYYASELSKNSIPNSLEQLILLCPSGMTIDRKSQKVWEEMLTATTKGNLKPFIESAIGPPPPLPLMRLPYKIILKDFTEFLLRKESLSILASFEKHHEMNHRASRIKTPTLLIWGEKDPLIPFISLQYWIKELNQNLADKLQTKSFTKGAHGLHIESPLAVAKAIANANF